jgi:hypothetical protein
MDVTYETRTKSGYWNVILTSNRGYKRAQHNSIEDFFVIAQIIALISQIYFVMKL